MCVTRVRVVYYRYISTLKIPYLLSIFRVIRVPTTMLCTCDRDWIGIGLWEANYTHITVIIMCMQYCTRYKSCYTVVRARLFLFFVDPPRGNSFGKRQQIATINRKIVLIIRNV